MILLYYYDTSITSLRTITLIYQPQHLLQEPLMKPLQLQERKLQEALCLLQLYLDHKPAKENQSCDFDVVL